MNKRFVSKIVVFAAMALFCCSSVFINSNAKAQSQTVIGHVGITGTATLSISVGALDTAFTQDCNYDSASDFHSAIFTDAIIDQNSGVWYLEGFGSTLSIAFTRGIRLTQKLNGDLVMGADEDGGGGSCESINCNSGCEAVGSSCLCGIAAEGGGGTCNYKPGNSDGGPDDGDLYVIPWGGARASIGANYLGNLY